MRGHPWDWRGVVNVLKVVALHEPIILNFFYGILSAPMPLFAIAKSSASSSLQVIVSNLKCLKLTGCTSVDGETNERPELHSEVDLLRQGLLNQAQQMTELSLSRVSGSFMAYLGAATWSHLTMLELGHLEIDWITLKGLCQRHRGTLQDLRLLVVWLDPSDNADTWQVAGRELGSILNLRSLTLRWLGSANDNELEIGLEIMRRIPRNMLEVKLLGKEWVEMRHL